MYASQSELFLLSECFGSEGPGLGIELGLELGLGLVLGLRLKLRLGFELGLALQLALELALDLWLGFWLGCHSPEVITFLVYNFLEHRPGLLRFTISSSRGMFFAFPICRRELKVYCTCPRKPQALSTTLV